MGILLDLALRATTAGEKGKPSNAMLAGKRSRKRKSPIDPAVAFRRQSVLELLAENPSARYALLTEAEGDTEAVFWPCDPWTGNL